MYDNALYDQITEGSIRSAKIVLPTFLFGMNFMPQTVIDVGCGRGSWAFVAQGLGMRVAGIDGGYVESPLIDDFTAWDLNELDAYPIGDKYDVAICLEVAEHLHPESADRFIAGLTNLAHVILFSAAIPGQNGVGHINEQWPSYWISKFEANGYGCDDYIRWLFWNNNDVENWYKQNMFVARKGLVGKVHDVVHPNNWYAHYLDKR